MSELASTVPLFYFTRVKNVGDQINPCLIKMLFGADAILATQDEEHLLAVGSLMGFANRRSKIWGTGVLDPSDSLGDIVSQNVSAVRGKLSYQVLKRHGLNLGDIPLGDPGFLVARVFRRPLGGSRRHRLGIVAHYVDRSHPWVLKLLSDPDVVDLNVHSNPEEFLRDMAACDAVVSSSLHGLVFAEALGIPNVWIQLSEQVLGNGFKFRDWFSLAEAPQLEPESPDNDTRATWSARATLHGMHVDADGLIRSFPFLNVTSTTGAFRAPTPVALT